MLSWNLEYVPLDKRELKNTKKEESNMHEYDYILHITGNIRLLFPIIL